MFDESYNFDLICVGAGIANIALALGVLEKFPEASIVIIEKGNPIQSRSCPKLKTGKCVDCKPSCQITTGFAGAGTFSDCKLSYSHEVGGNVIDYIGKDNFYRLLDKADKLFTRFGGKKKYNYNEKFANNFSYECSKYGLKLTKNKIRHLGTDGTYEVMSRIQQCLESFKNVHFLFNCTVMSTDFAKRQVWVKSPFSSTEMRISGTYVSFAVGRYGSEWLRKECEKQDVDLINDSIDVGVRVECPDSITDPVTKKLYEFKITNWSSTGNKTRSFCVNPGGSVVQENYQDGIACVNGHSYSTNDSGLTNFALLVSSKFTEPFNQPIEYGKSICRLSNMLADGKIMVQRLCDLKNHKRSTKDNIKKLTYEPSLKDAEPGDLRYVLPPNILDSILEWLEKVDNVMKGINGDQTILYSPEIKFYSSRIDVNKYFENYRNYPGIFFLGDSSGITHGIMQSAISGLWASERIYETVGKRSYHNDRKE